MDIRNTGRCLARPTLAWSGVDLRRFELISLKGLGLAKYSGMVSGFQPV
jgi:hypothetical protein